MELNEAPDLMMSLPGSLMWSVPRDPDVDSVPQDSCLETDSLIGCVELQGNRGSSRRWIFSTMLLKQRDAYQGSCRNVHWE